MKKLTTSILIILIVLTMFIIGCTKKSDSSQNLTPAKTLAQDFNTILTKETNISLEDLANKIISNKCIDFSSVVMAVEPGYLNGFSGNINNFSEGVIFAPMIGSIPFVGYVFKSDNPQTLMTELKENADLRWNICTQADEMICEAVKNTVFFVMAPMSFDAE